MAIYSCTEQYFHYTGDKSEENISNLELKLLSLIF